MTVKVVGLPGAKTQRTLVNAQEALISRRPKGSIEWVSDIEDMRELGLFYTPTVLINHKLKSTGRIPSVYEISTWIEEEMAEEVAT